MKEKERLENIIRNYKDLPRDALVLPDAPPPFFLDTLVSITTQSSADGCPVLANGQVVHMHMTGRNIRAGMSLLDMGTMEASLSDRLALVERCFVWAPTLKQMSAAARLAYAVVSLRRTLIHIGAASPFVERMCSMIYDVVDPGKVQEWEGALMSELPETDDDMSVAMDLSGAMDSRISRAFDILSATFGIAREIYWFDMNDNFGVASLLVIKGHLDALGIAAPILEPFQRFPLASGHPGDEERAHLRYVMEALATR